MRDDRWARAREASLARSFGSGLAVQALSSPHSRRRRTPDAASMPRRACGITGAAPGDRRGRRVGDRGGHADAGRAADGSRGDPFRRGQVGGDGGESNSPSRTLRRRPLRACPMVCRRPPERTSAPCRTVQSRVPRSGLTPDYATLIRIAAPLNDASTTRGTEVASTLTLLPKQRGRESTGGCQVLRFAALLTGPEQHPRLALSDSQALSKPRIPTGPNDCSGWAWYHEPAARQAPAATNRTRAIVRRSDSAGIVLHGRTSSTEDGGPDTLGRTAIERGGDDPRRARQLTSQAERACFEVPSCPAIIHPSTPSRACRARLALDLRRGRRRRRDLAS